MVERDPRILVTYEDNDLPVAEELRMALLAYGGHSVFLDGWAKPGTPGDDRNRFSTVRECDVVLLVNPRPQASLEDVHRCVEAIRSSALCQAPGGPLVVIVREASIDSLHRNVAAALTEHGLEPVVLERRLKLPSQHAPATLRSMRSVSDELFTTTREEATTPPARKAGSSTLLRMRASWRYLARNPGVAVVLTALTVVIFVYDAHQAIAAYVLGGGTDAPTSRAAPVVKLTSFFKDARGFTIPVEPGNRLPRVDDTVFLMSSERVPGFRYLFACLDSEKNAFVDEVVEDGDNYRRFEFEIDQPGVHTVLLLAFDEDVEGSEALQATLSSALQSSTLVLPEGVMYAWSAAGHRWEFLEEDSRGSASRSSEVAVEDRWARDLHAALVAFSRDEPFAVDGRSFSVPEESDARK